MKKMDFVKDDEFDELSVGSFPPFPGDNIPLLRGTHNNLGLCNLLLGQLIIPLTDEIVDYPLNR